MNPLEIRQHLFASLRQRFRPEDVAESVRALLDDRLAAGERKLLANAARGSLARGLFGYSSMSTTFRPVVGFDRQFTKARELFVSASPAVGEEARVQLSRLPEFVPAVAREIGATSGRFDFRGDRLNREAREQRGLDFSRRRYNKLFRFISRLEEKRARVERELQIRQLTIIGKSRLATQIAWEDFNVDDNTAAFVAYLTARANLRSEFTIAGQQRAYDEIADMLFQRCAATHTTRWWAIAHVYCPPHVVVRLSEEEKGRLLSRWFSVLDQTAALLRDTWQGNTFNRETMVVARGNDSSTWNNVAGAWNKGRDAWFALLEALGCDDGLARFCPGKVMRLMAADVAAWHRVSGGKLDPQTAVWGELPLPWDVLAGTVECPLTLVEATCRKHDVDAVKAGWTHARSGTAVAPFRATPELVHGVTVGHPGLALLFRRWGVFSGKPISSPFTE
jgi:hypothetical protein